jgi:arylsulfatase A-like enzyme
MDFDGGTQETYRRMITAMDLQIGRVIETLSANGILGASAVPRKLFWRYKANWQRAARDGDYKYLKILDNTFLFNVVEDPMERANLKSREPEMYDRLVA